NGSRLACAFTELQVKGNDQKLDMVSGIHIWSFNNPDKPEPRPIFGARGFSIEPKNIAWSPDGTKLAFEGWRLKGGGDRELRGIIVLDLTSAGQRGVMVDSSTVEAVKYMVPVSAQGKPQHPVWSPDGTRLLFEMTRPDGGNDLWVINSDGTNVLNLTKGVG